MVRVLLPLARLTAVTARPALAGADALVTWPWMVAVLSWARHLVLPQLGRHPVING